MIKNSSEEAYQEFKSITHKLAVFAWEHGAVFLVENYVNNIIGSVSQVARLMRDIDHPGLALALDPANYFDENNIDAIDDTLENIFNVFDGKIKIAHAKDCKKTDVIIKKFGDGAAEHNSFRGAGVIELPAAGLGSLNYDKKRESHVHFILRGFLFFVMKYSPAASVQLSPDHCPFSS